MQSTAGLQGTREALQRARNPRPHALQGMYLSGGPQEQRPWGRRGGLQQGGVRERECAGGSHLLDNQSCSPPDTQQLSTTVSSLEVGARPALEKLGHP